MTEGHRGPVKVYCVCVRYILNEQFQVNISRVVSKSVRRELTFWLSVQDLTGFKTLHKLEKML